MSILIVDDESDFRESLAEILKEAGYDVINASTANEALEYIATNNISMMLLDYSMPSMNGEQLIYELDRTKTRPPALIISALAPWQLVGLMKKGVGYIRKPVNASLLLGTIKSMVGREGNHEAEKVC